MITGSLKISRVILVAEVLLCFAPLSLMWIDAVTGVARLQARADHGALWSTPDGRLMLVFLLYAALAGLVGPLGLLSALRTIGTGWRAPRWFANACIGVPLPLVVLLLAAYGLTDSRALQSLDLWRGVVLLLLPVPLALHFKRIGAWPGPAAT